MGERKWTLTAAVLLSSLFLVAGPVSSIRFENVQPESGIDFILNNCPTAQKQMIETMAGGLAVFDFDGDGRPDIFFTNGASIPSLEKNDPKYSNHLYRNEGSMKFRDVTAAAGVAGAGYSMGAAAADFDNDGFPDLFVAGVNHNTLYRNRGNGRFDDVTEQAGIQSGTWAVAAGWFDYNNDGLLDLWIVRYAKWSISEDRYCGDSSRGIRIYCHPKYFQPLSNILYRNLGHGRFEDVSKKSGIEAFAGRGMSVAFADYDGDGYTDAFVTNDNMPNFLFHNRGDGTFEESALLAGVALREDGKPVASMGTDFRDYDNDGLPDIFVTALAAETFPLFRNAGKGLFNDVTYSSRVGALSLPHSGWGAAIVDFDNDGWKDFSTSNSHVNDRVEQFEPAVYKESNRIFRNLQNGTFADVSQAAGLSEAKAHRGSGYTDFDGDGKVDFVVSALGEKPELWHNIGAENAHWLGVKLVGSKSNRDGIGARIRLGNQTNQMTSATSYASSSLAPVHFGLGTAVNVSSLHVRWPSGLEQTINNLSADQIITVREAEAAKTKGR